MRDLKKLVGVNFTNPTLKVKHAKLERFDPKNSIYRSTCPACKEGLLLVHRGNSGELLAKDYCTLCGQAVEYTDIKKMNGKEGR